MFTLYIRDITQHKRAEAELRALPQHIIKAQEAERSRLARELHDGINQMIASVKMRLHKVEGSLPGLKPAAREILGRCDRLLVKVLEENRRIAHNLRPTDLDNLGLSAACTSFCSEVQSRANLQVRCQIDLPSARLPSVTELHLFRIVQEGINNIEKHSRAKTVKLHLRTEHGAVILKIQDDGLGFDSNRSKSSEGHGHGLGLSNMRERALSLGGTCEIKSSSGRGTSILVRVPLAEPKHAAGAKRESVG
jgi:two-component system NarL family sensor kinase